VDHDNDKERLREIGRIEKMNKLFYFILDCDSEKAVRAIVE